MDKEQIAYRNLTIAQDILMHTPTVIGYKEQSALIDLIASYRKQFHADNIIDTASDWKAIKRILDL